ncbi:MAG: hypothetical protein AAF670_07350 [Planctomycetota bacterium]
MPRFARHLAGWSVMVSMTMLAANLPMQLVSVRRVGQLQTWAGEFDFNSWALPLPVAAGWPMRFYERFDDLPNVEPYVQWSLFRLSMNVAIGMMAIMTLSLITYLLQRNRSRATKKPSSAEPNSGELSRWQRIRATPIRLGISDLLALTSLIAVSLATYQWLKRRSDADLELARTLGPDVSFVREAILPEVIADWAPASLLRPSVKNLFLRTTQVRLRAPNDQQVETTLSMPHLRAVAIGGGDYDLEKLSALPSHASLTGFHLYGRLLDDKTLARVRRLSNLRDLNLGRTNVSLSSLEQLFSERLVAASRLIALNVFDSGMDLSDVQTTSVLSKMPSLKLLSLPRPKAGQSATLTLPPMQSLQQLRMLSYDGMKNSEVTRLNIEGCPELTVVHLDMLQKYSFQLTDLPKLKEIRPFSYKTALRLAAEQRAPGVLWVESIDAKNLPSFKTFTFYASDLRHLRFTGTPNWEMAGPGVFQLVPSGYQGVQQYDSVVPADATRAFMEGIGESEGPRRIDYAAVPLAGADLTPLLRNPAVEELFLHQCGIETAQLQTLRGNETLKMVTAHDSDINGRDLGKLIGTMPGLERWHGDLYEIDRLRVEDHAHLKGVVDSIPGENNPNRCHLPYCMALRLVNLPNWEDPIRLDAGQFRHLTIQDLPRLKQLIIDGPVCKDAIISGLTGLETIAVGGEWVSDAMTEDWASYEQLQSVQLYGTSISSERFRRLLEGRAMALVDVRHGQLDDDAFLGLDPSRLESFSAKKTNVTEASVEHALKSPTLIDLHADDLVFSQKMIDRILDQRNWRRLSLDLAGWTQPQLQRLFALSGLNRLTVRNFDLNAAMGRFIIENSSSLMTHLTLIDSSVDGAALNAVARHFLNAKFRMIRTDIPVMLGAELLDRDRLIVDSEPDSLLYVRGPQGMRMPIFKQDFAGNPMMGTTMFTTFSSQGTSFEAMPKDDFIRLTPNVFFADDAVDSIEFDEPER